MPSAILPPAIWCVHDVLEIDSYQAAPPQQPRSLGGACALKVRCRACGQRDRVGPDELPAATSRLSLESLRDWRWVIRQMEHAHAPQREANNDDAATMDQHCAS